MRSQQWKTIGLTVAIACVLSCGVMLPGTIVAGNNKVEICHFLPDMDAWRLLSIERTRAPAHLEWHDDAHPGRTTSQTGVVLNKDCEKQRKRVPGAGEYELIPDILLYFTGAMLRGGQARRGAHKVEVEKRTILKW